MHAKDIVHRDIKPENILIDNVDELYIKLTDFGFATYVQKQDLDEVLGSPIYMPPEIVKHQKYNSQVDIWSAGVVAYVLLTGRPPFFGSDKEAVYKSISNDPLTFGPNEWKCISFEAKDFLEKLLDKNP